MPSSPPASAEPRPGFVGLLFHSRFRLALGLGLFLVVLGSLTRLALLLAGPSEGTRSAAALLRIFAAGGVLDLWVAAWCVLPLVAYLALLPERWWQARWQKKALGAVLSAVLYGVLFVAAAEWFFFEEFDSRFNFVAVDYLLYPTEVVTNIWQSYPTGKILIGLTALVAMLFFGVRKRFRSAWANPAPLAGRLAVLFTHAGLLALLAVSCSPRTLIEHSPDRLVRELTSNGTYAFGEALLGLDAPYDGFYATRDDGENHRRLEALLSEPSSFPLTLAPTSSGTRPDCWRSSIRPGRARTASTSGSIARSRPSAGCATPRARCGTARPPPPAIRWPAATSSRRRRLGSAPSPPRLA